MRKAIITGITGQDGSYLAELLLRKGYAVLGSSRGPAPSGLPPTLADVPTFQWDLRDQAVLDRAIRDFAPDEIYNFAAFSSGTRMFDAPVQMGDINGLAVTRILSSILASGLPVRFCQASSSEVFGDALASPQDESTPPNPRTPYGSAKLYAESVIKVFRRAHGVFACSAILFNHESPRRGPDFVTTKIAKAAARISLGLQSTLELGSLDARRDWGHAADYVEAMWLMLQHDVADDYVLATGATHSIAQLCDAAFSAVGLRHENHVRVNPAMVRPKEAVQLVGDSGKARRTLGWSPRVSFEEMVREMVLHHVDAQRRAMAEGSA